MNYNKVLYVGPNTKGGIGSVLGHYNDFLGNEFNFFPTIDYSNMLLNVIIF